jgi:hypothetical protein
MNNQDSHGRCGTKGEQVTQMDVEVARIIFDLCRRVVGRDVARDQHVERRESLLPVEQHLNGAQFLGERVDVLQLRRLIRFP